MTEATAGSRWTKTTTSMGGHFDFIKLDSNRFNGLPATEAPVSFLQVVYATQPSLRAIALIVIEEKKKGIKRGAMRPADRLAAAQISAHQDSQVRKRIIFRFLADIGI